MILRFIIINFYKLAREESTGPTWYRVRGDRGQLLIRARASFSRVSTSHSRIKMDRRVSTVADDENNNLKKLREYISVYFIFLSNGMCFACLKYEEKKKEGKDNQWRVSSMRPLNNDARSRSSARRPDKPPLHIRSSFLQAR